METQSRWKTTNNYKQDQDYKVRLNVKEKLQEDDFVVVKVDKSNYCYIDKEPNFAQTENVIKERISDSSTTKFQSDSSKDVKRGLSKAIINFTSSVSAIRQLYLIVKKCITYLRPHFSHLYFV